MANKLLGSNYFKISEYNPTKKILTMQQRLRLSNETLLSQMKNGLSVLTNYSETGYKPCEDYTLECKKDKSYRKLESLHEKFGTKIKEKLNTFHRQLHECNKKDEIINFLHTEFKTLNDIDLFFKSFNK